MAVTNRLAKEAMLSQNQGNDWVWVKRDQGGDAQEDQGNENLNSNSVEQCRLSSLKGV